MQPADLVNLDNKAPWEILECQAALEQEVRWDQWDPKEIKEWLVFLEDLVKWERVDLVAQLGNQV